MNVSDSKLEYPVVAADIPADLPKKERAKIYSWDVILLGVIAIGVVFGGIVASIMGTQLADGLYVLAGVAVTALAGLLKEKNEA